MLPPLTLVSRAPRSWNPEGPTLTLTALMTFMELTFRKQFSLRNEQMMSTALLISSRKSLSGWRNSLMNLSKKWLGVTKSDVGWGGENLGGALLRSHHKTHLSPAASLLPAIGRDLPVSGAYTCTQRMFLRCQAKPNILPSIPQQRFPWAIWGRSGSF